MRSLARLSLVGKASLKFNQRHNVGDAVSIV
jgi:hypothetical protein